MSSTLTKTFHVFPASIMTLYMKILVFKLISSWAPRSNQKGSLIYILQQMLPGIWAMIEMRNTAWDRTDPAPISKHQYTSGMTTTKASRSTITNSNNNKNNNEQTNAGNLSVMKANLNLLYTGCRFSGEERFYHLKQITIRYGGSTAL